MKRIKRSYLIIPISIIAHLLIINLCLYVLTPKTYLQSFSPLFYSLSWLLLANAFNYYPKERKEDFFTNATKMLQLYFVYGLSYFAWFGLIEKPYGSLEYQLFVLFVIFTCLTWYRVLFFWLRRKYRLVGGNSVRVVVLGRDANLKKIRKTFDDPYLGYRYHGYFDDKASPSPTYLGKIENCFLYILENDIEEIYCVASMFNHRELQNLINFADNNLIRFKIVLDNKEIYSRAMDIEAYGHVPVLNLRKIPLDTEYARIVKRAFDIVFSSFVIVFVLSWLSPLLWLLIRLDSPGTLYYKQQRHGLKRRLFWCYKYRSMSAGNSNPDKMATKNDARVTKIGKFLRKTSIDELPQFINVFKGEMSVVGPRPHMELHTIDYETSIDKYLVRHFVKPGITGLAQIKGYRGEIENKSDITNRVRLDIFYVEKWTVWLDLQIVINTVLNVFRGEEKAY